jgi:CubicO group peptidase (beta-lactamase class C family)
MSTDEINISNWRHWPNNQQSFINIHHILATHLISKSSSPSPLPNYPQAIDFNRFRLQHDSRTLDIHSFLEESHTDSLLALHHGQPVYEAYYHANTKHSPHILMSLTKPITALLVGILHARGLLSPDDLVTAHVPEVAPTVYRDVTIRQCIDMRAGARYVDGTHAYRAAAGWDPLEEENDDDDDDDVLVARDLHAFLTSFRPQEVLADDRFEYVSANVDLVGWVLERASGRSFADLVHDLLWEPLGAESDAWVTVDARGHARAAGGLCATVRDVARVGQMLARGGKGMDGRQVVPAEWVEDVLRGGDREAFARGSWARGLKGDGEGLAYRSGFLVDADRGLVMGLGVFGQMLVVDPENDVVVVMMGSQKESLNFGGIRMALNAVKEIRRVILE